MRSAILALAIVVGSIGCSDPMDPGAAPVVGNWRTSRISIGESYSREESLTFTRDGQIRLIIRFYSNGALYDRFESHGTYMVRGDSLFTTFAPSGPADALSIGFSRFNNGRLEFSGVTPRFLTITYPWFGPADEGITAVDTFAQTVCGVRAARVVQVEGCLN